MGKLLIIKNADFSDVAVAKVTPISGDGPTITISSEGVVTLTDAYAENIYYTINGDSPTTESTKYSGEFTVRSGVTVIAMSEFTDGSLSNESSKMYDSGVVDTSYSLLAEVAEATNNFASVPKGPVYYTYNVQTTYSYGDTVWDQWASTDKIPVDPNATKLTNIYMLYYSNTVKNDENTILFIPAIVFLNSDSEIISVAPTDAVVELNSILILFNSDSIEIPTGTKYVVLTYRQNPGSYNMQQVYWG